MTGIASGRTMAAQARSVSRPASRTVTRALWVGAALLAASALFVRARVRRAERDHPPTGRFIDVDGVRLHYFERGSGDAIVLLHGNGTMALDFVLAGTLDAAARSGHRVIAFDRPGFGYSTRPAGRRWTPHAQAELLAAAMRRLGVERATVLGHSWGTLVALAMARAHPERVRRLVLVSGYYFPLPRLDAVMSIPPTLPLIGTLMRHTTSPLIGRLIWGLVMRRMFGPPEVPPSFAAYPTWLSLRPGQLRAAAAEGASMVLAAWRLQPHYGELRMPVSIIAGTRDRQVGAFRHSERLHGVIKGSTLTLVPGQGHMLQHLAPEAVEAALLDDTRSDPAPALSPREPQMTAPRHHLAQAQPTAQ